MSSPKQAAAAQAHASITEHVTRYVRQVLLDASLWSEERATSQEAGRRARREACVACGVLLAIYLVDGLYIWLSSKLSIKGRSRDRQRRC